MGGVPADTQAVCVKQPTGVGDVQADLGWPTWRPAQQGILVAELLTDLSDGLEHFLRPNNGADAFVPAVNQRHLPNARSYRS